MWVVLAQGPVRVHNSSSSNLTLASIKTTPQETLGDKPRGFWYAIGGSWLEWMQSNMPKWEGAYDYLLEVDESALKIINTQEGLVQFTREYGAPISRFEDRHRINWARVAHEFKGIEIPEYLSYDTVTQWYVPSGCIWDASAIRSLELVQRRDAPVGPETYLKGVPQNETSLTPETPSWMLEPQGEK